jgi:hypothetical protein
VVSNDSSYTLELQQTRDPSSLVRNPAQRSGNWREQLQRDYLVTRGVDTEATGTAAAAARRKAKEKELKKNSIQLRPLARSAVHFPVASKREEEERKELVAALVKERAKADGIRDLVEQCYNCAAVGSWSKQRRRSVPRSPSLPPSAHGPLLCRDLVDVLQDCHDLLGDEDHEGQVEQLPQRHRELVQELVNYPDVYHALNHLLHHPGPGPGPGASRPYSASDQTTDGDEAPDEEDLTGALSNDEGTGDENGGGLSLSEDVMKYFHRERSRREELELDEIGRRVFGS